MENSIFPVQLAVRASCCALGKPVLGPTKPERAMQVLRCDGM